MQQTEAERSEAFERLADEHIYASYRLASAILGDASESRDAVHDAVLNAWREWDTLRDRTKFDPWFDRIVVNHCRECLRQAKRRRTEDIADQVSLSSPDLAAVVHQRIEVERAFARLKADDTLVLALRHFVDLEMDDIALLLDVPLFPLPRPVCVPRGGVYTRLSTTQPTGGTTCHSMPRSSSIRLYLTPTTTQG